MDVKLLLFDAPRVCVLHQMGAENVGGKWVAVPVFFRFFYGIMAVLCAEVGEWHFTTWE